MGSRRYLTSDVKITLGGEKICLAAGTVVSVGPNQKFDIQQQPCTGEAKNAALLELVSLSTEDQALINYRSVGAYVQGQPEQIVKGQSRAKRYETSHDIVIRETPVRKNSEVFLLTTGKYKFYQPDIESTAANEEGQPYPGELSRPIALTVDEREELEAASWSTSIQWGALVVPYKFQLSGDRDLKGGATIGAYVGVPFAFDALGVSLVPIAFFGAGNTSVRQVVNGEETDNNLFALSYGAGLTFEIDQSFQMGAVVGFDHVNDDAGYEYNDQPWVALQIGFKFTD